MASSKNSKIKNKKIANKNRFHFANWVLILALFVLILISTVFSDVVQIYKNNKEVKILEEKKSLLLEEEASLNSEVIKLQDPEYVARYAREKFLYTKDGEKILTIIDGSSIASKDDTSKEDKKNEE